tara:strand:+ start:2025 stop:3743 length:1719 start_codon:yes stop_codon:yes gene_type:complete
MKLHSIKRFLKDNNIDFYLITNNDLHLNESPNLDLKDIYKLFKFDCTRGYVLFFINKFIFFTDSRYTLAAKKFFKNNCEIYNLSETTVVDYLIMQNKKLSGILDSKKISVKEFREINSKLEKNKINIYPQLKIFFKKNYYPNFNISYPLSLPKYLIPRTFNDNLKRIKNSIKTQGVLIWNNAQVAYLLNIRSFELWNSTKPFAGLFIPQKNIKPVLITNNFNLKKISKISNNFKILREDRFIKFLKLSKFKNIETSYEFLNLNMYIRLSKFLNLSDSKINISKYLGIKTSKEIKNIEACHIEDGLAVLKFIIDLKQKKINPKNEYEVSECLYNKRKEGINFFRNSFDYISAFDSNAAIIHYKPLPEKSLSFKNRNILLTDSGAQYLEGTTDITRVIKVGVKNLTRIKYSYTYLLKSLIKIENKTFPKNIMSSEIDLFIRNYLSKFKIYYSHGTGHGVGNFGDVHEKYPIISSGSKDILTNNNLFSIEPGHYVEGKFGIRIENLYVTKTFDKSFILKNITLVPYDLDLIDFKLITNFERRYIKRYHKKIYENFQSRLSNEYKNYFLKNLIYKI